MAAKQPMPHLLIFLPGIMGSRLRKDNRDIWALSKIPLWQHLRALAGAGSIPDLMLRDDDWEHDLDDGVVASELIADLHAVPRVVSQAGYGPFRAEINRFFDVVEGSIHAPVDKANFYTFPYDWRRDNRATARVLGAFVERQLGRWRRHSGNDGAQVILVGHSMGGLVARYYVEVLEGWRTCQALITIGTPHWGSVDSVEALCNGKKIGLADFTTVVRALTSTHQLLPVYKMLKAAGGTVRIGEADVPELERARAAAARESFHEAIWAKARSNRADPRYRTQTVPWVGVEQDTLQSATLAGGQVVTAYQLPDGFAGQPGDGDGTVPRFAAIPPDLTASDGRFAVEQHGWLTNSVQTIEPVLHTIVTLAAGLPIGHLGGERPEPAINLRVEPLVTVKEGPYIRVRLAGPGASRRHVSVRVTRIDEPRPPLKATAEATHDRSVDVTFPRLEPGLYQVQARPARATKRSPGPVNSVFEVVEEPVDIGV